MRYLALSPDRLPIRPTPFASRMAAQRALNQWALRFTTQGYYSTAGGERIPLGQLLARCEVIEEGSLAEAVDKVARPGLRTLMVLVPRQGTPPEHLIDPHSAIVADPAEVGNRSKHQQHLGPMVEAYFEGNRYQASNLTTFEEKLKHAAGRLVERYPTSAKGQFRLADFHIVGSYHVEANWASVYLAVTDDLVLRRWLGEEDDG